MCVLGGVLKERGKSLGGVPGAGLISKGKGDWQTLRSFSHSPRQCLCLSGADIVGVPVHSTLASWEEGTVCVQAGNRAWFTPFRSSKQGHCLADYLPT